MLIIILYKTGESLTTARRQVTTNLNPALTGYAAVRDSYLGVILFGTAKVANISDNAKPPDEKGRQPRGPRPPETHFHVKISQIVFPQVCSILLAEAAVFAFFHAAVAGVRAVVRGGLAVVLQPLDARGDEGAGGGSALGDGSLLGGDEGDAHGLQLFLEVEVGLILHALRVQRVAERAQAFQLHALALRHIVGQHAGHFGQDGQHVGIADGAYLGQPLGNLLGFDGLAHHYGLREIDSRLFVELLFVISHDWMVLDAFSIVADYRADSG